MEPIGFSCGQAIKFGWKTMIRHIWFFISLFLISALITMIPVLGMEYLSNYPLANTILQNIALGFLILLFLILKFGFLLGMVLICLKYARGERPTWSDLFSRFLAVPSFIAASIMYIIIVIIGFILLIFPGFIWSVQFGLFPFFIADEQVGPIKALELSSRLTRGAKWDLYAFFGIAYIVFLIGALPFGLGLIIAIPTILLAYGWIYKNLREVKTSVHG